DEYWKAGSTGYSSSYGKTCWKEYNTNPINITLKGDLANSYMQSHSTNYTRGSTISFSGTAKDDCNTEQTDPAKFGLEFRMVRNNVVYGSCITPTTGFSCDIQTDSSFPLGWYNITMISFGRGEQANKYWNGTTTLTNAFFLGTKPTLFDAQAIPSSDGWGASPFNFTINVTDPDNDTVTVHFYLSTTPSSWNYIESKTCTHCNNTLIYFERNFTYNQIGTWYFAFNASDSSNLNNDTLVISSVIVERDDINILHAAGNNAKINRSNTINYQTKLAIQVNDTDYNSIVNTTYPAPLPNSLVHFYVENQTGSWLEQTTESNATHYYVTNFNPNCSYTAGIHNWQVNITNSNYYKNSSSSLFTITIIASLNQTILTPDGNQNFTKGSNITIRIKVTDDCQQNITDLLISGEIQFNLTNTRTFSNYTCTLITHEGSGIYNCTRFTNDMDVGNYQLKAFVNKSYHNPDIDYQTFFLSSAPTLTSPSIDKQQAGWGASPFNFTVIVSDEDNDTVTISLWLKNSTTNVWFNPENKSCTNCSNTLIYFERNFAKDNIDEWQYKFTALDTHNNYVSTLAYNFNVTKDSISIYHLAGNNTAVNRSSGSARLAVYIYDKDTQANTTDISQTYVLFYITNNTITWIEQNEQINTTGKYYYVDFNPTCNYTANKQKWQVNVTGSSYYKNNNSAIFYINVTGDLNITLLYPDGSQNHTKGDIITLNATLKDDCNNSVSISPGEGGVRFIIQKASTTIYCPQSGYITNSTGNYYECQLDTSTMDAGYYNVTVEANKIYHNKDIKTLTNAFYLKVIPQLKAANVTPRNEGWAIAKNFTINITDVGDNVTVMLWEKSPTGEWQQILPT
ncbi:MAG: hypothetical protein DRN92_08775, partial [Thermoproteota archaeon]